MQKASAADPLFRSSIHCLAMCGLVKFNTKISGVPIAAGKMLPRKRILRHRGCPFLFKEHADALDTSVDEFNSSQRQSRPVQSLFLQWNQLVAESNNQREELCIPNCLLDSASRPFLLEANIQFPKVVCTNN